MECGGEEVVRRYIRQKWGCAAEHISRFFLLNGKDEKLDMESVQ